MQRLGQHFLKNESVIKTIIDGLALGRGDRVVEVGPGHGELTIPLAEACAKLDCSLVAIEKDAEFAKNLRLKIRVPKTGERPVIIEGDVLKIFDLEISRFKNEPYKLVGNIPYYITGKLLRIVGEAENKPERSILMVQHEVAQRICAAVPEMNRLAASVQFWGVAEIIAFVPKKDFFPPPKIDSSVIRLSTKKGPPAVPPGQYYQALRSLFAQPRKTIANNLRAGGGKYSEKEALSEELKKLGIDPEARPQNLGVEEICKIAKKFF